MKLIPCVKDEYKTVGITGITEIEKKPHKQTNN